MELEVELPQPGAESGKLCKYRAVMKINSGSYGDILAAVNEADANDWLALKVESRYQAMDVERRHFKLPTVRNEYVVCHDIARSIATGGGCPCPAVRGCVDLYAEHDVLAMELLGPNLMNYAKKLGWWPRLPQDIVLVVGAALVGRLQQLHGCGFLHRDLKPENVVLCLDSPPDEGLVPCLLFVDHGFAIRYAASDGSGHICKRENTELEGTLRYMAIHAHQGVTQSRRSDLESLAHMLIWLARGQLPWQQIQDRKEMLQRKEQITVEELCSGLCPALGSFLQKCRSLGFEDAPDYEDLQRGLLQGVTGSIDFQAARVRRDFKQELQEAYLRYEAATALQASLPILPPGPGAPNGEQGGALSSMFPVFVQHDPRSDKTALIAYYPPNAADLNDKRSFFFEAYRMPLPGTAHIVIGGSGVPCHFFGFLREEFLISAHMEAGLEQGTPQQIFVFSLNARDWIVRSATLPDHEGWTLRSRFWARVVLPWGSEAALAAPAA